MFCTPCAVRVERTNWAENVKVRVWDTAVLFIRLMDGEVRYKCYVDCDGALPCDDVIRNSIYCPAQMLERYGAGIVDIVCLDGSAADAIAKCEN